jgi:hypothetical protein
LQAGLQAEDWSRFRGPQGQGLAPNVDIPAQWGLEKNLRWKIRLPGAGVSSPAVREGRIYLTCYSGYDRWEKGTDFGRFGLSAVCLGASGNVVWQKEIPHDEQQLRGGHGGTRWHGYATGTPLVDELGVYLNYGPNGFYALDHDGKQRWKVDLGSQRVGWGHGTSPIAYKDWIIVNASLEASKLRAYDRTDGEIVWETDIDSRSWSSPVLARVGSQEQLILLVRNGLAGFDPKTGRRLWYIEGARDYATTSPVVEGDVVYYSLRNTHGGLKTMALRLKEAGGPELLWANDKLGAVCGTPLVWQGKLYWSMVDGRTPRRQRGFYCADAATGKVLYHARPDPMPEVIYASPILAGDKILFQSLQKGMYVLAPGKEYKLLAHNAWDQGPRRATSTPVPLGDDAVLIRIDQMLYCVSEKGK